MSEKAPTPSNKDLEALLATLTEADVENFVVGASEQSALVKEFKANRQSPKVLSAFLEYLKGQKDTFELMLNKSTAGKAREIAQKKLEAIDKNLPIVEAAVADLKKEEEKTPPPDTSKKASATTEDPTAKKTKTSPTIQELRERKAPNFGRLFVGQEFTKTDPQGNLLGYIKISGGNKYSKAKEKGPYYKRDDDTRTPYFRINGTINIGTDAEETFNEKEITKQNLEKLLHAGFSKYDEKAENAKASEEKEKEKLPDPEEARAEEIKSQFTNLVVSQENASIGTRKKQKDLFDAFEKETSVEWLQKNIPHYQRYKQLVTNPDHLSIWRDQLGKQEAYLRTIEFDPSDNKYYRQEIKTSGKNKETKRLEYVEVSKEDRARIVDDITFIKARLESKEIDAALRTAKDKLAAIEARGREIYLETDPDTGKEIPTEEYAIARKAYFRALERKAVFQRETGQTNTEEQRVALKHINDLLDSIEPKFEELNKRAQNAEAYKPDEAITLTGEGGEKILEGFSGAIEKFAERLPELRGKKFSLDTHNSKFIILKDGRPNELVCHIVLNEQQETSRWGKVKELFSEEKAPVILNFSVELSGSGFVLNENPSRANDVSVWLGGGEEFTKSTKFLSQNIGALIEEMNESYAESRQDTGEEVIGNIWLDKERGQLLIHHGNTIEDFDPENPPITLSSKEQDRLARLKEKRDTLLERKAKISGGEIKQDEEEENPTSPITVEDSEKVEEDPEESSESETNNQESPISIPENISQYFNPDAETFRKSVIISIDDALENRSRGNLSLENTIAILRETIGTNKPIEKLVTAEWKSLEKQLAGAPETLGNGGYYETKEDISKRMRRFALNPIQELILIQQNKKEYNRDIFNFFARTEKKLAALLSAFEVSQKVLLKMGDKEFLAQVLAENPNILNDQEKADMRTDPLAAALSTPYISKAVKERLSAIDKKYNPGRQKIIGGISEEVSELININNSGQILRTLRTYTPEDLDALRIQSTNEWYFSFIQEERKHTAFFTSSGFSLQLLNFKEVATEQDGVQVYSDKARYTLISPSGSVIAENIQGYFDASRKMREEAEKHFDSLFKDKPAKEAGRSGELAEKLATFRKEIEAFNPTLISEVEKLLGEEEMDAFIEKSTTVGEFLTALEPVLEVRALAAENQETLEEVPLDEAKNWIVEELSNAGKTINKVRAVILGPNRFDIVINPGETSEETIGVDFDSMNDEANRLLKYLEGVLSKQITGVRMNSSRGVFLVETKASE